MGAILHPSLFSCIGSEAGANSENASPMLKSSNSGTASLECWINTDIHHTASATRPGLTGTGEVEEAETYRSNPKLAQTALPPLAHAKEI